MEPLELLEPLEPLEALELLEALEALQALETLQPLEALKTLEALEALQPLEPLEPLEALEAPGGSGASEASGSSAARSGAGLRGGQVGYGSPSGGNPAATSNPASPPCKSTLRVGAYIATAPSGVRYRSRPPAAPKWLHCIYGFITARGCARHVRWFNYLFMKANPRHQAKACRL